MMMPTISVSRDVRMTMRDGIELAGDVWMPAGDVPVPAILIRTPYDRSAYVSDVLRPEHCVEAGFAAVVQDVRGRFGSQGEWNPFDWATEAADAYDTIEQIAAEPWCSGKVAMSGMSYSGTLQLAASRERPPHLRAIVPAMASDPAADRREAGGGLRLDLVTTWLAVTAVDWLGRRAAAGHYDAAAFDLVLKSLQDPRFLYDIRPLEDMPLFRIEGFPIGLDELHARLGTPIDEDRLAEEIPALHIGGWFDFSHSSAVELFQHQVAAGNDDARLVMGPWGHSPLLPQVQGSRNFGAMASGPASRLAGHVVSFLRAHLEGAESVAPRVKYFLMNSGAWFTDEQWPPARARHRRLYLADSALADTVPVDPTGSDEFRYDPSDPTPTVGGRNLTFGRLVAGPVDQRPLEGRGDVLRYVGAACEHAVDIVGPVAADIFISTSARDTDIIVKLVDVGPDASVLPICTGILRLRYRDGFDEPREYVPGEVVRLSIPLGHTAWRVEPGHRIGAQIQSADFPHLDANLNTGEPLGAGTVGVVATTSVHRDRARPSSILITTLEQA